MDGKRLVATLGLLICAACSGTPAFASRLDGAGNNRRHPVWGKAGGQYIRVAAPNYADKIGEMVAGPQARYVSNRIFNDSGQNLFSENGVSQFGWAWGQFVDHNIGLRDERPAESSPIAFDSTDPLERFTNDLGAIDFSRTPAAPGSGETSVRQQNNQITSYIDGSNIYGTTAKRLDWLRAGTADGNPRNNAARLLLPNDYLPRVGERGAADAAPPVDLMGALMGAPDRAVVSGDVRANENIALTALHTLFAREHNRIVNALPGSLSQTRKFAIASRVVAAEQQYVTFKEFLPALGVRLARYRGYRRRVNASISNEFATVGYRAHSMIHGEFDVEASAGTYSAEMLAAFEQHGIEVRHAGNRIALGIPLNLAFGNPDLLEQVGVGPVLASLAEERQYRNDEQIDDSLRSVLFQIPKPGAPDPSACGVPAVSPDCFTGVQDLGAIDLQRGRDHGMPSYSDLRRAYHLPAKESFTSITGEATDSFPADPQIDASNPIDDPDILDFVSLVDRAGHPVELGSRGAQERAVAGTRRTTLAARLKAIYGSVDRLDAFTGMVAEKHVPGTEFGELQLAIWKRQFRALRDGDRFFYGRDRRLRRIARRYGITYRHKLSRLIELNTSTEVAPNLFRVAPREGPAADRPQARPPRPECRRLRGRRGRRARRRARRAHCPPRPRNRRRAGRRPSRASAIE